MTSHMYEETVALMERFLQKSARGLSSRFAMVKQILYFIVRCLWDLFNE